MGVTDCLTDWLTDWLCRFQYRWFWDLTVLRTVLRVMIVMFLMCDLHQDEVKKLKLILVVMSILSLHLNVSSRAFIFSQILLVMNAMFSNPKMCFLRNVDHLVEYVWEIYTKHQHWPKALWAKVINCSYHVIYICLCLLSCNFQTTQNK